MSVRRGTQSPINLGGYLNQGPKASNERRCKTFSQKIFPTFRGRFSPLFCQKNRLLGKIGYGYFGNRFVSKKRTFSIVKGRRAPLNKSINLFMILLPSSYVKCHRINLDHSLLVVFLTFFPRQRWVRLPPAPCSSLLCSIQNLRSGEPHSESADVFSLCRINPRSAY